MDYAVRDFTRDVLQASAQQPVLVDFWAGWCAPCKMLGPILEQLAAAAQGRWTLIKVDVDAHPDLARQYQVRGIPAVKLFIDGRVVDEFTGALPQSALEAWLAERIPSPAARQVAQARTELAHGRRDAARDLLQAALATEPESREARGLLALAVVLDDPQQARELATGIREDCDSHAAASAALCIADLLTLDTDALPAGRGQADYRSAIEALRAGDIEAALGHLIACVIDDRAYRDDGARKACVALFELLGAEHPQLRDWRRRLQRALN
ncbi:MAG: thioredoxin [Immundisolibacter sp.]